MMEHLSIDMCTVPSYEFEGRGFLGGTAKGQSRDWRIGGATPVSDPATHTASQ